MTDDTSLHHARLLRALAREVRDGMVPALGADYPAEKVAFARLTLEYLAADLDVAPEVLAEMRGRYRAALAGVPGLAEIAVQEGVAAQREIAALRALAGRVIRELSDAGAHESALMERLGALDAEWLTRFEAGMAARRPGEEAAAVVTEIPVTPAAMTAYLRRHFPGSPGLEVRAVAAVPGGRSKRTLAISLENTKELPAALIMRQDMALKYAAQSVAEEVGPLARLAAQGLPVPRPLHFEAEANEFGQRFFLTPRLAGAPPGDFFGLNVPCPNAIRELAVMLARLHRLDTEAAAPAGGLMQARIEEYWTIWKNNATRGSALVEYAYAQARGLARLVPQVRPVLVHGDIGAHNWLVENDRLMAVLDWEMLHLGDPAEDLGVARAYAREVMPWAEFMEIYARAGGPEVPEAGVDLAELLYALKGTTLVATSARNFAEGGTSDYIKATNSFTGLRRIEMKILKILSKQAVLF